MRTVRLRVELDEVEPPVVRVVDVPAAVALPELHRLLQAAVGWTDSHLHRFEAGGTHYEEPDPDGFDALPGGPRVVDETGVGLAELPTRFTYLYDFGDGWEHTVEVVGEGGEQPGCVAGEGACPPEDCGGPDGYSRLRAALAAPQRPEHAELAAWAGDVAPFDLARTDGFVRQMAGAVPDSVRLVLDLAAGGVRLTPGGRLPRVFVRAVQEVRPHWAFHGRPASREEDLLPLAALHDVLRDVGLLRPARGVLEPIRAAADDVEVVRRLRGWFGPVDGFPAVLAAAVTGLLACGPPRTDDQLSGAVAELLGPGWSRDGKPLGVGGIRTEIARISAVLRGLDLVEADGWRWSAGPSARSLLPLATSLAHHRSVEADS